MRTDVPLVVLRCFFIVITAGLATWFVRSDILPASTPVWAPWLIFFSALIIAGGAIAVDVFVPRKRIDIITAVYFGVLIGLILTYAITIALSPLMENNPYSDAINAVIGVVICYTCISMLIQTKDDFRFIIPYVEFSKEVKGLKPYVLDTSVIIDGRIADLIETNTFDNPLIMPRFVLAELQGIADSNDRLRRARGRRGLDVLNRMRTDEHVEMQILDRESAEMDGQPVDMKLVLLAKELGAKIVTGDYNLNKVARLHSVEVINLNDIANSLKPVYLPGEQFDVKIVKAGESPGQGVGYLEDGTMIVVEGGRDHIHETVRLAVTSVLQTSAGRMIFGRFEETIEKEEVGS